MARGLLLRASARHLGTHPLLTALSLCGIALGVAVVVSIDLANQSAFAAFQQSAGALSGRATHHAVGGPLGVPDAAYAALAADPAVEAAAPVVEGHARVAGGAGPARAAGDAGRAGAAGAAAPAGAAGAASPARGRTLTLLGVDPFAEGPFRAFVPRGGAEGLDVGALLTRPGACLLSARTAAALGVGVGGVLRVQVQGVTHALPVLGLLAPEDERTARALEDVVLLDVASAQEVLGRPGRLTRVDLRVRDAAAVRPPAGVTLVEAQSRTGTVAQMTRAFRTNLSALSLLALVVGTFLIYNTMTFSVVQRRPLLGRLRALGVTRGEVLVAVLGEALVLGLVGTVAGLLLGVVLAHGLVGLVAQTLNDLYFAVSVRRLSLEPLTLLKGLGLGLFATLAAAAAPAREAAASPPAVTLRRSSLEGAARARAPRLALLGVGVLAAGAGALALPTRALLPAYAGLFAVLLGAALLAPALTLVLARAAVAPLARVAGLPGRLAARGVSATLSRTSVALAALSIAVATTVGVGLMVASFRGTVVTWLETSLRADVYVSPPSVVFRRGGARFEPGVVEQLVATPGVAAHATVFVVPVQVGGREADLVVADADGEAGRAQRYLAGGSPEAVWAALAAPDAVAVSEPFAFHHGVGVGGRVVLPTDAGARSFRVVAVYADYASDAGALTLRRDTYARHWRDAGVSGLALWAAEGTDPDALAEAVRARAGGLQALVVRPTRALRQASLEVFDRTFTVTQVLRLLAVGVAFIGVLSALMALQLERARELAVLRATGLTPGQVWGVVTLQTLLLGLFAGLLALPLGVGLAAILVHAINRRSFGWTLQLAVAPGQLWQALALALVAAALAGLYPAWRMSRASAAHALREEG